MYVPMHASILCYVLHINTSMQVHVHNNIILHGELHSGVYIECMICTLNSGHLYTGALAQCCAHYGQGSGPVQVQNVVCLGPESNLRECSHSDTPSGDHGLDVGVQCQPRAAAGKMNGTLRPLF